MDGAEVGVLEEPMRYASAASCSAEMMDRSSGRGWSWSRWVVVRLHGLGDFGNCNEDGRGLQEC